MAYQIFHGQIDEFIASNPQETVPLLLRKGRNKVETVNI